MKRERERESERVYVHHDELVNCCVIEFVVKRKLLLTKYQNTHKQRRAQSNGYARSLSNGWAEWDRERERACKLAIDIRKVTQAMPESKIEKNKKESGSTRLFPSCFYLSQVILV